MFPRKPLAIWQSFAQGSALAEIGFAGCAGLGNDARVPDVAASLPVRQDCYPFPSPWPGPTRVRPFFRGPDARQAANRMKIGFLGFELVVDFVELLPITTNQRGSSPCGNLSFSLLCSQHRLPVAWTIRPRAAWPVRPLARFWPVPPTTTPLPVRSLAALPARRPARCLQPSARPATDLTAAFAAPSFITASRATAPAGRFSFVAPVRGPVRRKPCSTRS